MTDYDSIMQLGLYRKQTGIVIGDGALPATDFEVDISVADNCNSKFQNAPSADKALDTYTLGFEYVHITAGAHAGAYIAAHIDSLDATKKTITLDANTWDGETCEVAYYAAGRGVTAATAGIKAGDYVRPQHPDGIAKALSEKGTLNPIDEGLVYDQCMGHRACPLITNTYTSVLRNNQGTITGTWSFGNTRPYYICAIRIEVEESTLQSGKGIQIKLEEDGTEVLNEVVNNSNDWFCGEYNDTISTIVWAQFHVGMLLCKDANLSIKTNGGNTNIAAESVRVWFMGWHMPDPVPYFYALEDYLPAESPAPVGLYREDTLTASAARKVTVSPNVVPTVTGHMRTHPHYRSEYRYGVEYAKNLTTGDYVTSKIRRVAEDSIYFYPEAVSENDQILIGYYAGNWTQGNLAVLEGDTIDRSNYESIIRGLRRLDRCDFGDKTFPFCSANDDTGEYAWSFWQWFINKENTALQSKKEIGRGWQTLLSFDPQSFQSRVTDGMKHAYTDRSTSGIDETPFFITGFMFEMGESPISGGVLYDNAVEFRFTFNTGTPNARQHQGSSIKYYACASPSGDISKPVPGANNATSIHIADGAGPFFYIPFGMIRCYSFKVEVRVREGPGFVKFQARQAYIEGWMVDE